jgi:hypothetical protein
MTLKRSEIETTRQFRRLFEMAATKSERDAIVNRGAAELGIKPRSLRTRWHKLGMSYRWNFMGAIVQRAIAAHPFETDRALARRYGQHYSSFSCARRRLGIPSGFDRRKAALRDEIAIYAREYPELRADEIRASIVADGEITWPFSVRHVARVLRDLGAE